MKGEIWKDITLNGVKYDYSVSNFGRVKNLEGHILKLWKRGQNKGTYFCIDLYQCGIKKRIDIQRLVALHFIPNPENKPEVNHWDLNHFNNNIENLEWVTRRENMRHSWFMRGTAKVERIYRKAGIAV